MYFLSFIISSSLRKTQAKLEVIDANQVNPSERELLAICVYKFV